MNDPLIALWVITHIKEQLLVYIAQDTWQDQGNVDLILHVLFYLETWTKINGKFSCMQVKCNWVRPTYVKEFTYDIVKNINFPSARKLKTSLDTSIEKLNESESLASQGSSSLYKKRKRANYQIKCLRNGQLFCSFKCLQNETNGLKLSTAILLSILYSRAEQLNPFQTCLMERMWKFPMNL